MTLREYRVGDAVDVLSELPDESAALVHLDDAWRRPARQGAFGVEYPTHRFETTTTILDECRRILSPGGWLIADADDWFLPRLLSYLRDEWGDVTEGGNYTDGGYRRVGGVTYVDGSGDPDTSTPGQYLSNGGYPVVFAHRGDTDRRTTASARQQCRHPRRTESGYPYGHGSIKPIDPYLEWIGGLCEPGELVVVPCAGSAPAAIAGDELGCHWLAVDVDESAREAFEERRAIRSSQTTLGGVDR